MLMIVVTINCAIAVCNFFLAWKIWRSRQMIRQLNLGLTRTEQNLNDALEPAPYVIAFGQVNIRRFRNRSNLWMRQWSQMLDLLSLLLRCTAWLAAIRASQSDQGLSRGSKRRKYSMTP